MKNVILIPGLGDNEKILNWITKGWEEYGFKIHIHVVPWGFDNFNFISKFKKLLRKIDELSSYNKVNIVGISAGGSMALNAYCERKSVINKIVSICGRIKQGKGVKNPDFQKSVLMAEDNLSKLKEKDCKKIMTISALYDEIVPVSTISLPGALNIQIPVIEHLLSILVSMTIFKNKIFDFLGH